MMLKKYFKSDTRVVLGFIILVELIYNFIFKNYILTEKVLYNSLVTEMTDEQFLQGVENVDSYTWAYYLATPLYVLLPIIAVAFCLNIGTLLKSASIPFKAIFGVVTKAYIAFALGRIIMLGVYFGVGIETVSDFNYMPSLSLFDAFDRERLAIWMVYPLQTLSVFQIAFVALLAFGLSRLKAESWRKWIPFVLGTYGVGLAIWVLLIVFLIFV
jgi:hypothetical protein